MKDTNIFMEPVDSQLIMMNFNENSIEMEIRVKCYCL